jgi:hypothetical protein
MKVVTTDWYMVVLACLASLWLNVDVQAASHSDSAVGALRPRMNPVKTIDFYLRNGELVFGKLASEDKNKVAVERIEGSRIVLSIYSKREIDSRTMQIKTVPEYKYYLELADYFSGRTWDFRDDPDDFIQAIRSCEEAKQSVLQTHVQDSSRVEEIDQRIQQLQADREVWIREVESRAKLKKLEFEAEAAKRLAQLENNLADYRQLIEDRLEQLSKAIADIHESHAKIEANMFAMEQRMNMLISRTEANRRRLDPFGGYRYPRYHFRYQPYLYIPQHDRGNNK